MSRLVKKSQIKPSEEEDNNNKFACTDHHRNLCRTEGKHLNWLKDIMRRMIQVGYKLPGLRELKNEMIHQRRQTSECAHLAI